MVLYCTIYKQSVKRQLPLSLMSCSIYLPHGRSITRSFVMLNTMMENKNTIFSNISIPFMFTAYAANMISGKGSKYQKNFFLFSIMVFNMMKLLVILFIMNLVAQINIFTYGRKIHFMSKISPYYLGEKESKQYLK